MMMRCMYPAIVTDKTDTTLRDEERCPDEATVLLEVYASEPTRFILCGQYCPRHATQLAEAELAKGHHPQLGNL